jgi:tRNA threonylcarbamoyladenosine biosynthesis protein TsaE
VGQAASDRQTRVELVSSSPAETEAIGGTLAQRLEPGDLVLVSGELGAGKTIFVRGACRALGVAGPVTSPTYTIGHRYEGRVPVSHLDLFRLETVADPDWAELEPYLLDAIVFIEWPEAGSGRLPAARLAVHLAHVDPERRHVVLECAEPGLLAGLI